MIHNHKINDQDKKKMKDYIEDILQNSQEFTDNRANLAVMYAIELNDNAALNKLINIGANIEYDDNYPLRLACKYDYDIIINTLFAHTKTFVDLEALMKIACKYDSVKSVNFLIAKGAPKKFITNNILEKMASYQDLATLKETITSFKNLDLVKDADEIEHIAFELAMNANNVQIMEDILKKVENKYTDISNMILEAARINSIESIKMVKKYNIHIPDRIINHACNIAALKGNEDFLYELSQQSSDKEKTQSLVLIYLCAFSNKGNIIERLLEDRANIHYRHDEALYTAAQYNKYENCKILLEYCADISAQSERAIKAAVIKDNFRIVELLLKHGSDVNVDNDVLIRLAAQYNSYESLKILIDHGANISACNNEATILATKEGFDNCLNYLIANITDITNLELALYYAAKNNDILVFNRLASLGVKITDKAYNAASDYIKKKCDEFMKR